MRDVAATTIHQYSTTMADFADFQIKSRRMAEINAVKLLRDAMDDLRNSPAIIEACTVAALQSAFVEAYQCDIEASVQQAMTPTAGSSSRTFRPCGSDENLLDFFV